MTLPVQVFTTCPPSVAAGASSANGCGMSYRDRVVEVARWSEAAGCEGILVYTDNRLVDPWLTAQLIIEATERLCPLVAVQPAYMHPYTVAKMVGTFGYFYERKIYLNMVAGGFKRDLEALNDHMPHDERYVRLVEYSRTIQALVANSSRKIGYSLQGTYYSVEGLRLSPPVRPELLPGFFVSGSSEAGARAAREIDAVAVCYPQPASQYGRRPISAARKSGVRFGIITRDTSADAWCEAEERFPPDRRGEIAHNLAMKTSDSHWHQELSERPEAGSDPESPYWLRPFRSYQTFCPYLVGSCERVAKEVARYMAAGFDRFILDIPVSESELELAGDVFKRARRLAA